MPMFGSISFLNFVPLSIKVVPSVFSSPVNYYSMQRALALVGIVQLVEVRLGQTVQTVFAV
jgi:hypothetical protein